MLKLIFVIISIIFVTLHAIYKIFICKLKRTPKISIYLSIMAGILLVYILNAFVLTIFINGIINKLIILLLGLTPFIIGTCATYEKEKYYSWLQIIIITIGAIYISLI